MPQGSVAVFLNTNGTQNPNFTFNNTTGMDLIRTSLSNFTFFDRVQGDDKPRTDGSNDGIKVELTGGATGGHLRAEGTLWDDDFRVTESTATSTTVAVRAFGVWGNTRAGAGVSKVTIQTDTDGGATVQVATAGGGISGGDLPGLAAQTSLHIESLGDEDTILLGGADNASVNATVRTGKGNDRVILLQDAEADGTTTARVDFDPNLGGLGSGNRLNLGEPFDSPGLTGINCTATLARMSGTHTVTLDQIYMIHNPDGQSVTNGDTPATVIIEDPTRLGEARLYQEPDAAPTAVDEDPYISVEAPLTVEHLEPTPGNVVTTGIVYLGGTMDFDAASRLSTVYKFEVGVKKDLPPFTLLDWADSRGVVNVESGSPLAADLTVQVDSRIATLNIPGNGKFTFQARGIDYPQTDARSLLLKTLAMGTTATGVLNLNDNSMIIDHSGTTPFASIRSYITSGYAGGAWNGNGINSAVAATAALSDAVGYAENDSSAIGTAFTTFAGRDVDNTAVLVKYTFAGDADLNGNVNLLDFNRVSANFGQTGPWGAGDFNYDTNVNLADFNLLSSNFGSSGLSPLGGEGEYTVEDLLHILMEMYPEYF